MMRILSETLLERRRQSRFADTRLAGDQHRVPVTAPCSGPEAVEQSHLLFPSHQRRVGRAQRLETAQAAPLAQHPPSASRWVAWQLRPGILEREECADLPLRAL